MKKRILIATGIAVATFFVVALGRIAANPSSGELGQILKAGLDGFRIYLDHLVEVLKIVW